VSARNFVKSADTKTPASQSQVGLEKLLRRYGATGFGVQSDYEKHIIRVTFRVPETPGSPTIIPVRLEVSIAAIARALFPQVTSGNFSPYGWEQAERVAWRHLVLWVDAACSAANAGLQSMSEAFFAHVLTKDNTGRVARMVEHLELGQEGGLRALLAPPEGK
jgi:hypothetical protein